MQRIQRIGGLALTLAAWVAVGCGGSAEVVPLLSAAGVPIAMPNTVPLEIVTQSTAVADPLPVRNTALGYAEVESALGHAVASATAPWAEGHRKDTAEKGGWQLFVEITNADADYEDGRVVFTVGVRATLRARAGNVFLAQTQASCRQGGIVPADRGAPVMYRCMTQVGDQLAGWLTGVDLDAVGPPRS